VAVTSSIAFAYTAPSLATGASLTTSVVNQRRVRITITSVGTASCPGSALSTSVGTYVRSDLAEVFASGTSFFQYRAPGPTVDFPTSATTLTFDVRRSNDSGPNAWVNGDSFSVTVIADFTCTYGTGSRTARLSSVRTLTFNGSVPGDWIVT
jgi:hypothetical protein